MTEADKIARLLREMNEYVLEFWAQVGEPVKMASFNRRFAKQLSKVGMSLNEARVLLQSRGGACTMMTGRGTSYLFPFEVWNAMGDEQRMLKRLDLDRLADGPMEMRRNKRETLRQMRSQDGYDSTSYEYVKGPPMEYFDMEATKARLK